MVPHSLRASGVPHPGEVERADRVDNSVDAAVADAVLEVPAEAADRSSGIGGTSGAGAAQSCPALLFLFDVLTDLPDQQSRESTGCAA